MVGAIHSEYLAQLLIGLRVDFSFKKHGTFTGEVIGYDVKEDFGHRILHVVKFSDGDIDEYSYTQIMKGHEDHLKVHCGHLPRKSIIFDPSRTVLGSPPVNLHTSLVTPAPYSLPVPRSLSSYPLRVPVEG